MYCSRECMGLAQRGKNNPNFRNILEKICVACNAPYFSYDKRRKYCSRSCASKHCIDGGHKPWTYSRTNRRPKLVRFPVKPHSVCTCCHWFYSIPKGLFCYQCNIARRTFLCRWCDEYYQTERITAYTRKYCSTKCTRAALADRQSGDKSHLWKGGITSAAMKVRNSLDYHAWRTFVFERDKFECQMCHNVGGRLAAHHIYTFAQHPEWRLETWNGITLCWSCHGSIHYREGEYVEQFLAITT